MDQVSGRILIDTYGYNKYHSGLDRKISETESSSTSSNYIKRLSIENQERNRKELLSREQDLIFVSPMLPGFSLKSKLWCQSPGHNP